MNTFTIPGDKFKNLVNVLSIFIPSQSNNVECNISYVYIKDDVMFATDGDIYFEYKLQAKCDFPVRIVIDSLKLANKQLKKINGKYPDVTFDFDINAIVINEEHFGLSKVDEIDIDCPHLVEPIETFELSEHSLNELLKSVSYAIEDNYIYSHYGLTMGVNDYDISCVATDGYVFANSYRRLSKGKAVDSCFALSPKFVKILSSLKFNDMFLSFSHDKQRLSIADGTITIATNKIERGMLRFQQVLKAEYDFIAVCKYLELLNVVKKIKDCGNKTDVTLNISKENKSVFNSQFGVKEAINFNIFGELKKETIRVRAKDLFEILTRVKSEYVHLHYNEKTNLLMIKDGYSKHIMSCLID